MVLIIVPLVTYITIYRIESSVLKLIILIAHGEK